jgi:hypothetical protein
MVNEDNFPEMYSNPETVPHSPWNPEPLLHYCPVRNGCSIINEHPPCPSTPLTATTISLGMIHEASTTPQLLGIQ